MFFVDAKYCAGEWVVAPTDGSSVLYMEDKCVWDSILAVGQDGYEQLPPMATTDEDSLPGAISSSVLSLAQL